jgi:hypothetical protein
VGVLQRRLHPLPPASGRVRKQAVAALGLVAAALVLALVGRLAGLAALDPLAGLLLVAGIVAALGLLPLWARLRGPPMPGLFTRPTPPGRWCGVCGRPAPPGACPRCRTEGRRSRRILRGFQRK